MAMMTAALRQRLQLRRLRVVCPLAEPGFKGMGQISFRGAIFGIKIENMTKFGAAPSSAVSRLPISTY